MLDASAVSISPTSTVPDMVGSPLGATLAGWVTAAVAALVRDSENPSSSVNLTLTFMVAARSPLVSVWVDPVAPGMSVSVPPLLRTH